MRKILSVMALLCFLGSSAYAQRLELRVQEASPIFDVQTQNTVLNIQLDEASRLAFANFTSENVGRVILVYIEDDVVLEPKINEPILGGQIQINGEATVQSVTELAVLLVNGERRISVAPSD